MGKWQQAEVQRRWKRHLSDTRCGSQYHIHRAIRKYGAEAFTIESICEAGSAEELGQLEQFFILLFRSYISEFGYNATMGGDGGGESPTVATRQKLAASKIGSKNPQFGKRWKMSFDARRKLGIALQGNQNGLGKKYPGRVPWNKGIEMPPLSEEHKSRIGETARRNGKRKGKPLSAEWRANLRAGWIKRRERERKKRSCQQQT